MTKEEKAAEAACAESLTARKRASEEGTFAAFAAYAASITRAENAVLAAQRAQKARAYG